MYNFIDLKIKNRSKHPLQLKIWLTKNHLKWCLVAPHPIQEKFHIFQKNHVFVKKWDQYFRYNELYREQKIKGHVMCVEKITTNFAPVLYEVNESYLRENDISLLDLSE